MSEIIAAVLLAGGALLGLYGWVFFGRVDRAVVVYLTGALFVVLGLLTAFGVWDPAGAVQAFASYVWA
jgi:hypothetical protein